MKIKTILSITFGIFIISILIYLIPFYLEYRAYSLRDIKYEDGISFCLEKIKKTKLRDKKYFYLSAWNTRCNPCLKEMPMQDDIADSLSKNIGFIHVSDDSDEKNISFLRKKNITSRNFIFLNDMNTFISAVYKKKNINYKVFPTHIVIDSIGNLLYFSQGSITHATFPKGKILNENEIKLRKQLRDPLIILLETLK